MNQYLIVTKCSNAEAKIWPRVIEQQDDGSTDYSKHESWEFGDYEVVIGTYIGRNPEEAIEKAANANEMDEEVLKAYQLEEKIPEFMTFDEFFSKAQLIDADGKRVNSGPDAILTKEQVSAMSNTMHDAGMEHYVYTLVAGDDDIWYIHQGWRVANRIGHMIGLGDAKLGEEIVYW